jgi:hypothetical protein
MGDGQILMKRQVTSGDVTVMGYAILQKIHPVIIVEKIYAQQDVSTRSS